MLSFFYNGIKANGGKLQRAHYSDGQLINHPAGTLTIYARDYDGFCAEVRSVFTVMNDSDFQSDYVVTDVIRVRPDHPMYLEVKAAMLQGKAKNEARWAKKLAKAA